VPQPEDVNRTKQHLLAMRREVESFLAELDSVPPNRR
jgi:hypothetical protein